jgi:hypothetical protein
MPAIISTGIEIEIEKNIVFDVLWRLITTTARKGTHRDAASRAEPDVQALALMSVS